MIQSIWQDWLCAGVFEARDALTLCVVCRLLYSQSIQRCKLRNDKTFNVPKNHCQWNCRIALCASCIQSQQSLHILTLHAGRLMDYTTVYMSTYVFIYFAFEIRFASSVVACSPLGKIYMIHLPNQRQCVKIMKF